MTPEECPAGPEHCHRPTKAGPVGRYCHMPAGHGTAHPGHGACHFHGGNVGKVVALSSKRGQAIQKDNILAAAWTLGPPRQMTPAEALIEELHRTAGCVLWLSQQVASITPEELPMSLMYQVFLTERRHLVEVARTAIACGAVEKVSDSLTVVGDMFLQMFDRVFEALEPTEEQRRRFEAALTHELRRVAGD